MISMKDRGKYESVSLSTSTITGVFGWMFYGLLVTALMALGLFLSAANGLISVDSYYLILIGSTVVFLIYSFIAAFMMARSTNKTKSIVLYTIYSLLLGAVLSSIFITFDIGSITASLGTTCLVFGIMAVYGYFTKRDLTRFASILTMLLIGALLMTMMNGLLSLILGWEVYTGFYWGMSYIVLGVVIGYVAFDIQRLKRASEEGALVNALPIFLAFNLYSDFVVIFLRILQIIGASKN